jgi:ATP-dependent DNA ligase
LPEWIGPQLTELIEAAPDGDEWLHETKFDGYCTHARLEGHGLETRLRCLRARQSRLVAQGQMALPPRIYRGRLVDPEGRRPWLGALLLASYDPDGRLVYAGRVGTGIKQAEFARLWRRLQPLATTEMPLDVPPPRTSRFGSPLVLSRVHWVRPKLVAEVKFLT